MPTAKQTAAIKAECKDRNSEVTSTHAWTAEDGLIDGVKPAAGTILVNMRNRVLGTHRTFVVEPNGDTTYMGG
jgi:hypothetical protein